MRSVTGVLAAIGFTVACSAKTSDAPSMASTGGSGFATAGVGGTAGTSTGALGGAGSGGAATGGSGGMAGSLAGGAGGALAGGDSGGTAGASGGAAGASGGTAGTANAGAGGGSGLAGSVPSAGCGMAATDTPETFSQHTMTVDGHERSYYVRLPAGYDQNRAYPLTIMGPGCGGRGDQSIPIQDAAGPDAIVVGLNISAEVTGRDCFMTESAESPELPYFDAMWAEVSAGYCIDTKRVLYGGFSSGAWLANLYGCAKSNILRVQASVAGGPPPLPECPDPIAAIFIHDVGDNTNGLGGVQAARDRVLMKNGCTGTETMPWDPEYPDCEIYTGCPADYPVVWCEPDSGMGHNPLDAMSAPAFWKFFSALGPKP